MSAASEARKAVLARVWAAPDYFPATEIVRWARLDETRAEHVEAITALTKAKGDDAIAAAIIAICDTVERAFPALRADAGLTWEARAAEGDEDSTLARAYREAAAQIEPYREEMAHIPRGDLTHWAGDVPERLVEPLAKREALQADWELLRSFVATLNGATRLVDARILPVTVCEAQAARGEAEAARSEVAA